MNFQSITSIGLLMILFPLLLSPGCVIIQRTDLQDYLSPDQVNIFLQHIQEQEKRVSSFYALGHITVKGWVWESDANLLVVGRKDPFQIKIEITHEWGRPILHFRIHDGQFEAVSFEEKKIYVGDFTPLVLSRFFPGVLADPALIWAVVRGYPYLIREYQIEDQRRVWIRLVNHYETEMIDLDAKTLSPMRMSLPNKKIHVDFSDIQENNEIEYAKAIMVRHDPEKRDLIINYEKMVFDKPIPETVFSIIRPTSYEVVYLDEGLE